MGVGAGAGGIEEPLAGSEVRFEGLLPKAPRVFFMPGRHMVRPNLPVLHPPVPSLTTAQFV